MWFREYFLRLAQSAMLLARPAMPCKRTRATGTWQLVNRHGVLPAVRKRLRSRDADDVQPVLAQLGMADYSFSAVEAAYPEAFAAAA